MALRPGAAAAMVEGARRYMATAKAGTGDLLGATLLVSEDGAEAMSVTFWTSRAAIEANEAAGTFEATMKPFEPLFRAPYQRAIMEVGSTTLLPMRG
jgi:hypothetical protein